MPTQYRSSKYRFPDRAKAEQALATAEGRALRGEWFATAILQGRLHPVGTWQDGDRLITVGYFADEYSGYVYAISNSGPPHCIRGLWHVDDMDAEISLHRRYESTREYGQLLDAARQSVFSIVGRDEA